MSTEYQEDKKPLNAVQYAAKDYPTYFDSLLTRLREQYGDDYNDFASTSVGMMLVNLMAYGLSQLSWYLDRRSSESYLATARTLDAVTRLASQIGYKPKRASAASADLNITFDPLVADTIMARGFKFSGPSGLTFQLMTDVRLSAGATSASITVSEGQQRTQTFTSSGVASQIFILPGVLEGQYIADQSVRVFVNGLEWSESDFLTYEKTNQFAVSYTTDPPRVILGDGSAGNIPVRGADIRIDYRIISAEAGNVRSNTITSAIDRLLSAGNFVTIKTVTNPTPASGGSGPQSIAEIKKIAPLAFQAGGSAVTQQDYYAIVNSFSDPVYGSVSKGYAAVTRSLDLDVFASARLDSIDAQVDTILGVIDVNATSATVARNSATTNQNALNASVSSASTALLGISTAIGQERVVARQAADESASSIGALTTAIDLIPDLDAAITAGDAPLIGTLLNNINTLMQSARTNASNAYALSTSSTVLNGMETLTNTATAAAAEAATQSGLLELAIDAIMDQIQDIQTDAASPAVTVSFDTEQLREHLSGLFDDSCKSNVVTVPILVEGREGFFQAPSTGLIRSLQTHLDEVKEVTHLVKVVSGASALVPAHIKMRIKYDPSYIKAEVRAEIIAGLDALLRRRDFHASLYISDLYAIVELINGINYINITIEEPAGKLDGDGNLIVGELEVVTKGSVTIEEV